jgi:hypothetical protein
LCGGGLTQLRFQLYRADQGIVESRDLVFNPQSGLMGGRFGK